METRVHFEVLFIFLSLSARGAAVIIGNSSPFYDTKHGSS